MTRSIAACVLSIFAVVTAARADKVETKYLVQVHLPTLEAARDLSAAGFDVAGVNRKASLAGVVVTMYDPSLPFHREVVENLREHLGEKVCRTVIPRDVVLAEAASHGLPSVQYQGLARGTFSYVELGKEMLGHGGKKAR